MFCPNCGKEVADGAKFCPSCGASVGSQQVQPARKVPAEEKSRFSVGAIIAIVIVLFLVVIVGGIVGAVLVHRQAAEKNPVEATEVTGTQSAASAAETQQATEQKEKEDENSKKLRTDTRKDGSQITYGVVSNVMIAAAYATEIDHAIGNSYHSVSPQGKFIAVAVVVMNGQNDAITVSEASYRLIDRDGREYSTSSRASTAWMLMTDDHQGILTQINPGNYETFVFIYDVPSSMELSDFQLKATAGIIGDSVIVPFNQLEDFKIE